MAQKPKQLHLPMLPKIHIEHPEIGKALDILVQYIRKNVTPVQGNKV